MLTLNLRKHDDRCFGSFARYQEYRTGSRIPSRRCRWPLRIDGGCFRLDYCDAVGAWCVARAVTADDGHYVYSAGNHRQKGPAEIRHRG
jgi:hypothetical protein